MALKAGYKGKVEIGATAIGGATTWNYSGSVRNMHAQDAFGDEIITHIPLQVEGGEITITGNYLMHEDTGQQLLKTKYDSGDPITDIKLYTDKAGSIYLTPDSGTTPASYVTVTNYDNVANDKSAVGTFTCTLKVSGKMKPMGTSSSVQVVTTGIHGLIATACEFVGELVSMGGQTPISCYFEYGTTLSFGTDTSGSADSLTAVGLFGAPSGTLVTGTKYYYRAVANYDTDKYAYGAIKEFTTP
jgi:hypothetical protein